MSYQKMLKQYQQKIIAFYQVLSYTGNDRFENMFAYQTTFKIIKYEYSRTEHITN